MYEQFDIAIISALEIEREAIIARLDGVEKLQFDDEPLTFYAGSLPANGDCYRVVAVQSHDMGNNDASIAATRTIQRFAPTCVFMVGIAGGVKGKANLGDIVVAQYAHYYEFAKLKQEGREDRPQQCPSDVLLYARAQHYDESDWRGDIRVSSPAPKGVTEFQPDVRFGPIACGDKVIESETELGAIRQQCPKMLAVAMEGWGVAKAVAAEGRPIKYLEIRSICDQAIPGKNDDWHAYAANAAAAFAIGLLKTRPMRPLAAIQRQLESGTASPILIITAQSLRKVAGAELVATLPPSVADRSIEFVDLDFTDLVQNKQLTRPEEAASRVADSDGKFVQALASHSDHQLAFHGLCSIPLVVLAGHVVSDRQSVRLFDFQPDRGDWAWPETDSEFPTLELEQQLGRRVLKPVDVVVRVSVSYPVVEDEIRKLGLPAAAGFHLTVSEPTRSIVRSEKQTLHYGRSFRRLLDALRTHTPNCRRVHLFYAGPMALAFNLGQQVSENIHPPVIAWNFSRGYDWGIDLTKAMTGEPCVLTPEVIASDIQ